MKSEMTIVALTRYKVLDAWVEATPPMRTLAATVERIPDGDANAIAGLAEDLRC